LGRYEVGFVGEWKFEEKGFDFEGKADGMWWIEFLNFSSKFEEKNFVVCLEK
jgi:hypothetical protein